MNSVYDIIVQPRLRIGEMNDKLSKLMDDPIGILLMQSFKQSLVFIHFPFFQKFPYLFYLLLRLTHFFC